MLTIAVPAVFEFTKNSPSILARNIALVAMGKALPWYKRHDTLAKLAMYMGHRDLKIPSPAAKEALHA